MLYVSFLFLEKHTTGFILLRVSLKKHPPESKRIISTAAKILISEIRSHTFECDSYPANECDLDKSIEWLPPKLRLFMETLFRLPIKRASIGQCLANAIRPKVHNPVTFFWPSG